MRLLRVASLVLLGVGAVHAEVPNMNGVHQLQHFDTQVSHSHMRLFQALNDDSTSTISPDAPTTDAPATTNVPVITTTDAPATDAPTTQAPATDAPTTLAPATDAPTTAAPTTATPTTAAPTSTPAPTSPPIDLWTYGYGFTSQYPLTPDTLTKLPLPPHNSEVFIPNEIAKGTPFGWAPVPPQERFPVPLVFGASTLSLATMPFAADFKRKQGVSRKYNNTAFTSVQQFPKVGAGLLTSIDPLDDEFFGLTRLNGPNPTIIKRISTISSTFGEMTTLRAKYPNLDDLLATGHIFECDYNKLSLIPGAAPLAAPADTILAYPNQPNPGVQQRWYPKSPYVLLAHINEKGCEKLVPIAIQLEHNYVAGQTAVLYRVDYKDANGAPLSGVDQGDWNYAKTIVNSADAILHELDAHLVKTHFVMENIIIGIHMALPRTHPISRLIVGDKYNEGHSYKTLQINEDGRMSMLPGLVDELFAGGLVYSGIFVDRLYATYNWIADYIPNDLNTRGFHDFVSHSQHTEWSHHGMKNYLYASDAMQSWDIIADYVENVLKVQYPTDADVAADVSLQAWAKLLSTQTPGLISAPVPGFPKSFATFHDIVTAVTAALYKSTVGHSVVNYPQPFYNAYIPAYPTLALYQPPLNASQVGTGLTTDAYIASALGNANTQTVMADMANALGQPVAKCGLPDDITLYQFAVKANATIVDSSDTIGVALQSSASQLLSDLTSFSDSIQQRDAQFVSIGLNHYQYGYFDPKRVANAIYA